MAETTDELLARMAKKYGLSNPAPSAGNPQPNPQPTPSTPQPPEKRGLIDTLRGRGQQIDKAAGYSKGGKICGMAHGGKISGPGTPTSDSIPAEVQQTGEPIKVSTGERILSAEQDAMLADMARKMGFDSLDAMLESGTGKPVGPTVKGGQRAAAMGMSLTDFAYGDLEDLQRRNLSAPVNGPAPIQTTNYASPQRVQNGGGNLAGDALSYLNRGDPIRDLAGALSNSYKTAQANAVSGADINDPTRPQFEPKPAPLAAAATQGTTLPGGMSRPGAPSFMDRPADQVPKTAPTANPTLASISTGGGAGGGGTERSVMDIYKNASDIQAQQIEQTTRGGIIGNSQDADRRAFDNFVNRSTLESALASAAKQGGRGSGQNIASIASALGQTAGQIPAQELARDTLAQQGDIRRTELAQDARYKGARIGVEQDEQKNKGLLAQLAGLEQADKAKTNALTRQDAQSDVDLKQMKLGLLKTIMDPNADPKAIAQAQKQFQALSGKDENQGKWQVAKTGSVDASGNTVTGYDLVNDATAEVRRGGGQAQQQMPPGMTKQVGTSNGKPVYEDQNGKRFIGN